MAGANRCSALNYRFDLPLSFPIKLLIFIALIYLVFRVLLYGFSVQFFVFMFRRLSRHRFFWRWDCVE